MSIQTQNREGFDKALSEGVILFLGSHFTTLPNEENKAIPNKAQLLMDIKDEFKSIPPVLKYEQTVHLLERTKKTDFYKFLKKKFTVTTVNKLYLNLLNLNTIRLFTTTIDNQLEIIFEHSKDKFLHDVILKGDSKDKQAVLYVPLFKNIRHLHFSITLSSTTAQLKDFQKVIDDYESIFIGYDSSEEFLKCYPDFNSDKKKWIILSETVEIEEQNFFRAMGFDIVIANTDTILRHFESIEPSGKKTRLDDTRSLFPDLVHPESNKLVARAVSEFYKGTPPLWWDIIYGELYKTHHFNVITEKIDKGISPIYAVGVNACGKTTLMMQLYYYYRFNGHKLITFDPISEEKANLIVKQLGGKPALIFMDHFSDSVDALRKVFDKQKNIKIVAFEREYNYEIVMRILNKLEAKSIAHVTGLNEEDMNGLYEKLPIPLRVNRKMRQPQYIHADEIALFEFIETNINSSNIRERFTLLFEELKTKEEDNAIDFFIMCCYVYLCRSTVSVDLAWTFLEARIYEDITNIKQTIGNLVSYLTENVANDQDYFGPRSLIVAEIILKGDKAKGIAPIVPRDSFERMFKKFHRISPVKIPDYNIFKKYCYDSEFVSMAYEEAHNGIKFYETIYERDNSPHLLQQCALYLMKKRKYREAFKWIDKAMEAWAKQYPKPNFSIKNSHAIILFEANIQNASAQFARETLNESMKILVDCHKADRGRFYHTKTYANQAVRYWDAYRDPIAKEYLKTAYDWLEDELAEKIKQEDFRNKRFIKDELERIKKRLDEPQVSAVAKNRYSKF